MNDRVKRKIDETAALQVARRDRGGVHDRLGLSTRGTRDRFVEAQMVEQPPEMVEPGGEQDVIVQPTTPPGMGDEMQPVEEPLVPEEDPAAGDEEQKVDVDEEMKRTLFNTLSELIDLGRIGRNEEEIRQYVEEHENEVGELIDVLDEVVDMLIGEGDITRETHTFDVGDDEQPATGEVDFREMKPGVGGQVPQGGTSTTVIASDRSRSGGESLHESIMSGIVSGADIDRTLERVVTDDYGTTHAELVSSPNVGQGSTVQSEGEGNWFLVSGGYSSPDYVESHDFGQDREGAEASLANAVPGAEDDLEPRVIQASSNHEAEQKYRQMMTQSGKGFGMLRLHNKQTEGFFSNWYSVSKTDSGFNAQDHGTDKKAAKDAVQGMIHGGGDLNARVVRASDIPDAVNKYQRFNAHGGSVTARADRQAAKQGQAGKPMDKVTLGGGLLKRAATGAAKSGGGLLKRVAKGVGGELVKSAKGLGHLAKGALGMTGGKQEFDPAATTDKTAMKQVGPEKSVVGQAVDMAKGAAGMNVKHGYDPVAMTDKDATAAASRSKGNVDQVKGALGMDTGPSAGSIGKAGPSAGSLGKAGTSAGSLKKKEILDPKDLDAVTTDKQMMKMTKGEDTIEGYQSWTRPGMAVRSAMGEASVTWKDGDENKTMVFESVDEAKTYARDLFDLGTKGIYLNEELNVTRTGMAVEVVFDNKQQAAASKGALLQYKGIDTVKDVGDGTLVVFTTDEDPEEARNRVTTILQNARVPMEGTFKFTRWAIVEQVVESNPGGQSAIGGSTPKIGRSYNGPDLMPAPLPVASGQSGADLEGEDDKCPYCGGTYQNDVCSHCKRIKKMPKVDYRDGPMESATEAGDQDPEMKAHYMQPFYAPDDADLPPGPEGKAVPTPGDEDFVEPDYGEEPGEAPEDQAAGVLWRMEIPEEPEEMERLKGALERAQGAGVIDSWVEIDGDEELPADDAGVPIDTGMVDMGDEEEFEINPELMNEPIPTTPPGIGEEIDDEFEMPVDDPSVVMGDEPSDIAVDDLSVDDPAGEFDDEPAEESEHYITVEFAAETEQEEREGFVDWISDDTSDPETGEGGLLIVGWKPDEGGEGVAGEIDDEIPGEIPGENLETSPEEFPEFSEDLPPMGDTLADEVPVPEEKLLGEDVGHLRNIFKAVCVANTRGDGANVRRFTEALVKHGHGRGVTRVRMARILRTRVKVIENIYPDLARSTQQPSPQPASAPAPSPSPITSPPTPIAAPGMSPDLQGLHNDYVSAKEAGDEDAAARIMNELRFQAEKEGVDVGNLMGDAGQAVVGTAADTI